MNCEEGIRQWGLKSISGFNVDCWTIFLYFEVKPFGLVQVSTSKDTEIQHFTKTIQQKVIDKYYIKAHDGKEHVKSDFKN